MSQTGKFIVIDGTDGSGKATQTELLVQNLKAGGFQVEVADFPQYNTKSAGLVEEYLGGKYGEADKVGPYVASIFYACDRYDASFKIRKWLDEGKIVISNRYVTANMGHQGGKLQDHLERRHYFNWLYNLEYEIFGIPRPDLNIILHVPAEISQKLSQQRTKEDWKGKDNDIHQNNLNHLREAEAVYLEIAKVFPNFTLIECTDNGQMLSRDEISGQVWNRASQILDLKEKQSANKTDSIQDFWEKATIWENNEVIKIDVEKTVTSITNIDAEKFHSDMSELIVARVSPTAKLPARAHATDAGLDLFSLDFYLLEPGEKASLRTGIKMAIPEGYVGLIWDKSSLSKQGLVTSGGVIDSGYRGEIMINVINLSGARMQIEHGQKLAQLLIQKIELPKIMEGEVNENTTRGANGFGSTGKF